MSKIFVHHSADGELAYPYTIPAGFEDVSSNISANGLRFRHAETGVEAVIWSPEQEVLSDRLQAAIDGSCRAALARHGRKAAPETLQDLDRETYGFDSLKTSTTQAPAKIAMGLGIKAPTDANEAISKTLGDMARKAAQQPIERGLAFQVDQKPVARGPMRWDAEPEEIRLANTTSIFKASEAINPKEIAGSKKPSVWSVMPRWIVLQVGRVMSVGAAKYGAFNYRESTIAASTYQDALERHLGLWFDGEDNDHETGVSHLASAIASCTLLMDAQATGKLVDDRQKTGLFRKHLDALEALLVTLPLPSTKVH